MLLLLLICKLMTVSICSAYNLFNALCNAALSVLSFCVQMTSNPCFFNDSISLVVSPQVLQAHTIISHPLYMKSLIEFFILELRAATLGDGLIIIERKTSSTSLFFTETHKKIIYGKTKVDTYTQTSTPLSLVSYETITDHKSYMPLVVLLLLEHPRLRFHIN